MGSLEDGTNRAIQKVSQEFFKFCILACSIVPLLVGVDIDLNNLRVASSRCLESLYLIDAKGY